jgi:thioredoxin reductase (NADPH)
VQEGEIRYRRASITKSESYCCDVTIIGFGVAGLYATYCCGLAKLRACIAEFMPVPGGQCTTLYPDKRMHGAPGFTDIKAKDYVSALSSQCLPHADKILFNHNVVNISRSDNNEFIISTDHCVISSRFLILATGIGGCVPNIPTDITLNVDKSSDFIQNYCVDMNLYTEKRVIVAGGGDSAIDFATELSAIANQVILIHRRENFSCEPTKLKTIHELVESGKVCLKLHYDILAIVESEGIRYVKIRRQGASEEEKIATDHIIFCYGFSSKRKLIPGLETMGIQTVNSMIRIDITTMETAINDCYAIGDVVTYPDKKRSVVSCFFEADRAVRVIRDKIGRV